ncbi:tRNA (adenosine(37)-N6)-threonylcarbamoyltransferase complex ATPase subunit type 1 TsaE [Psychroserpens sp. XS_ASV72]|uniref:tRNA (adenosine(37)-N6)-threonylcarbamoyltransferase complex ATPase subunit type 1 TsaE n=1 Tax=Psychroserpens sp. XS_ASV72 TaxID=3241293 RepID=UPI0035136CB0
MNYQIDEIDTIAKKLIENFSAKTILFEGDLGAGKTRLIKALTKALGSNDDVTSPTFSIVNTYKSKDCLIHHFDMYRIEDEIEALNFGFEDYLNNDNDWLFIEWPDRIVNLLPIEVNTITISKIDTNSRALKLSLNELLTQKPAMEHCKTQK